MDENKRESLVLRFMFMSVEITLKPILPAWINVSNVYENFECIISLRAVSLISL